MSYNARDLARDLANGAPFNTRGVVLAAHIVVSYLILPFHNPLSSSDLVVDPLDKTGIIGVFHGPNSVKLHDFVQGYII